MIVTVMLILVTTFGRLLSLLHGNLGCEAKGNMIFLVFFIPGIRIPFIILSN